MKEKPAKIFFESSSEKYFLNAMDKGSPSSKSDMILI